MVLPDRTWAVDGGARLPRVPSVRQARLGDAMTRPSPRKVGKALPALIVEMRWQDGCWWWCDVRLRSGPKFPPLSAYHRSIGYTRVKYVPSLPRKAGARSAR